MHEQESSIDADGRFLSEVRLRCLPGSYVENTAAKSSDKAVVYGEHFGKEDGESGKCTNALLQNVGLIMVSCSFRVMTNKLIM